MNGSERAHERLREAFAAVDPGRWAPAGCPDPGEIWDAVHGEVPPKRVGAYADHVAECPSCAEDWRLAREALVRDVPARPRRVPGWAPGLAAAAAALMAVALLVLIDRSGPDAPVYRDPGAGHVESLVPEDRPLARTDVVLRWSPVGEGASYEIEVASLDLRVLASAYDLREPRFRVPATALEGLPEDATLVWKVEAVLPDGARIVSDAFLVRIE